MKAFKYVTIVVGAFLAHFTFAQSQPLSADTKVPDHPRLLLLKGQEKEILSTLKTDTCWAKIHQSILDACDAIIPLPALKRIKTGKRLLDVSREALRRIFYLSYAYRMTHQDKYLKRAEKELRAVALFSDWNPSHFLDVGEMTMAAAIGYDWLYNDLSGGTRSVIKDAILKNGINESLNPVNNSWLKNTNNWNQVCNAGIVYGAMATYEEHPDLSLQIINRAILVMDLPMGQYAPDGAYPEGYGYWEYGTTFNVMLISALETAFGKDFGLAEKVGFLKTPSYLEHMTGISGMPFNYSDCGAHPEFSPAMFWFARKTNNPSLLWTEKRQLLTGANLKNRLLPGALIWGRNLRSNTITPPKTNTWVGRGVNPVALMRTSWTSPDAIFVGLKGGSPSLSHAHMDAGSFVMEANGVRWGIDLGMQDYESLESKKVDLWNSRQDSQRWQVLRYNNLSHNTLTINNSLQDVKGSAKIISYSAKPMFQNTVVDLTSLYSDKVVKAIRGVAIVNKKYVLIRDDLESFSDSITVRWSMVTPALVKITGKNTAELTKNGKKLLFEVDGPAHVEMKIWSTKPKASFDATNPGTCILGFEVKLPAHYKQFLNVLLIPKGLENSIEKNVPPLNQWPGDKL
jgi:hypothetical protein